MWCGHTKRSDQGTVGTIGTAAKRSSMIARLHVSRRTRIIVAVIVGAIGLTVFFAIAVNTVKSGGTSGPATVVQSAGAIATSAANVSPGSGVQVVDGGEYHSVATTTTFGTAQEALAYASSKAGFQIPFPAYLPPGYALTQIGVPPKRPPEVTGGPLTAQLTIRSADKGFTIEAVNQAFHFSGDDPGHVIATPAPGSQIFKGDPGVGANGVEGIDYHWLTPSRGADLIIATHQLTEDEIVRILSSMPQD